MVWRVASRRFWGRSLTATSTAVREIMLRLRTELYQMVGTIERGSKEDERRRKTSSKQSMLNYRPRLTKSSITPSVPEYYLRNFCTFCPVFRPSDLQSGGASRPEADQTISFPRIAFSRFQRQAEIEALNVNRTHSAMLKPQMAFISKQVVLLAPALFSC